MERDRARFRQVSAAVASAGRAFDKPKVLLDEIESEMANALESGATPYVSSSHRPIYATNPAENPAASADSFDESRKLPSGVEF